MEILEENFTAEFQADDWNAGVSEATSKKAIQAIESGKVLVFPHLDFTLSENEKKFLSPVYSYHKSKNISFNRRTNSMECASCTMEDYENLKKMMRRYSEVTEKFLRDLFPPYARSIQLARTSYRPIEAARRRQSDKKDDTLLHVDSFPSTPVHGRRILRVFTNINPEGQARVWRIGEPFPKVAEQFLPGIPRPFFLKALMLRLFKITKTIRSGYDHYMLEIHDRMKANKVYQANAEQQEMRFAPGTTWIVQTDQVSHAAMSGQFVMEQTFYLPVDAMVNPDLSPLHVLEKIKQRKLASRKTFKRRKGDR